MQEFLVKYVAFVLIKVDLWNLETNDDLKTRRVIGTIESKLPYGCSWSDIES